MIYEENPCIVKRFYVKPNDEGRFVIESTGDDKTKIYGKAVSGVLKSITTKNDPGNKAAKIPPHTKLSVYLEDPAVNEGYYVQAKHPSNFSNGLVNMLGEIKKDEAVIVSIVVGNEGAFFCNAAKVFSESPLTYEVVKTNIPVEVDQRTEWANKIVSNHDAFVKYIVD